MEITTQKRVVDISTSKPTNVQVTPPSTIIEENAKTIYSQQQTIENQQELISDGVTGNFDEMIALQLQNIIG